MTLPLQTILPLRPSAPADLQDSITGETQPASGGTAEPSTSQYRPGFQHRSTDCGAYVGGSVMLCPPEVMAHSSQLSLPVEMHDGPPRHWADRRPRTVGVDSTTLLYYMLTHFRRFFSALVPRQQQ